MFEVVTTNDYMSGEVGTIHLLDEFGEIVMWDGQDWVDEPALVGNIVEFIVAGFTRGPKYLRTVLWRNDPVHYNYITSGDLKDE